MQGAHPMTDIEALAKRVAESDLVKRLREQAADMQSQRFQNCYAYAARCREAADYIEMLRRSCDSVHKTASDTAAKLSAAELALTTAPRDAGERQANEAAASEI